jgi:hypothetical protein
VSIPETLALIEWAKLAGTGIGYVDASLLASARLIPSGSIFTSDKSLRAQARRLALAYQP